MKAEQVREAIMRLHMCACRECEICKYKSDIKDKMPSESCKERENFRRLRQKGIPQAGSLKILRSAQRGIAQKRGQRLFQALRKRWQSNGEITY